MKCSYPDGVTVQMNGVPVDACVVEDVKKYRNVTVVESRCRFCGNISWSWKRQENTEEITDEEA